MAFSKLTIIKILSLLLFFTSIPAVSAGGRRLLHQPFFLTLTSPPPTEPPSCSPRQQPQSPQQPKYPFSTTSGTPITKPFFPFYPSPPPPSSVEASLPTFPANISTLIFPQHDRPHHQRRVTLIAVSISLLFSAVLFSLLAFFLFHRHRRHPSTTPADDKSSVSDSLRLVPPNVVPSDGSNHRRGGKNQQPPKYTSSNTSSEFLYLGTLVNSRSGIDPEKNVTLSRNSVTGIGVSSAPSTPLPLPSEYQKQDSPELRPLSQLPRYNLFRSGEMPIFSGEVSHSRDDDDAAINNGEDDEFFSPRGSSDSKERNSPNRVDSSSHRNLQAIGADRYGSRSFNSRTASCPYSKSFSPTDSVISSLNASPAMNRSPASISSVYSSHSGNTQNSPDHRFSSFEEPDENQLMEGNNHFGVKNQPPLPPPLPPVGFLEIPADSRFVNGPPVLVKPSRPVTLYSVPENLSKNEVLDSGRNEESWKPKLKALHWDKVKASSDRAMVWDQIPSKSSFQLNEEMIETLFTVKDSNLATKENGWKLVGSSMNQNNRVLDPKKSQNVAILLRALNVTISEIREALLEGNSETLGTELLESLLKMAPTKEEEQKLKEFKDESPFKLGHAEKFLKEVLEIPFAFKRIDAMLYIVNFQSEVDYLKNSFETLEVACKELRTSRMFLKLLEAVLKTGNRMNVGTNRGDAHAFKLDTLLKLVDVKGTDGKTTLLHFVVQEVIRSEGSRCSSTDQNPNKDNIAEHFNIEDDIKTRKLGLQVVSGLSGELENVKKAATIDPDILINEVAKLASGITKVKEVAKMNEGSGKFSKSMNTFLNDAQEEIIIIQARKSVSIATVKEITEYFHGNSANEGHPFRTFIVVRDFLTCLEQVCKEVGKINDRNTYTSVHPLTLNHNFAPVFPEQNFKWHCGSSDEERSSF